MAFRDSNIIDGYITAEPDYREPDIVGYCFCCDDPLKEGQDIYEDGEGQFCNLYCALDWHEIEETEDTTSEYCEVCGLPLLPEYEAYKSHADGLSFCSVECVIEEYKIKETKL
jgi:hypothetical protein